MKQRHSNPNRVGTQRAQRKRGVASVLAMMFLVIFGSLAAAMAVVAQGNLRTADSSRKVSRAMSAAETGLIFAAHRLQQEGRRFVIEKGVVDGDYGHELWQGTFVEGTTGDVTVMDPEGYTVPGEPDGVIEAIFEAHLVDTHAFDVDPGDASLPSMNSITGVLICKPIALSTDPTAPYFRLRYELVVDIGGNALPMIRVTSTGHDRGLTRTVQLDFNIEKKIEFAILSPNRIMIGKNVRVEGPLGTRYGLVAGELDPANGDPLVLRGDFFDLDDTLTGQLDTFYANVVDYDVDGDGRLRPDHPSEDDGLTGGAFLTDYDDNEYVDDFDIFLQFYDDDNDHMVVYDEDKAAAAGLGTMTEEFTGIDDQLALLIDKAYPDRNGDGIAGDSIDMAYGWNDGVLDANDTYAKVNGRLGFAVAQADWETAHGESYQTVVQGPIVSGSDEAPVEFETEDHVLLEVTTDLLTGNQTWFSDEADTGADFATQTASGGTYTAPSDDTWESVPLNAPGAYDYYQRPIYDGYTFNNLRIPPGTNALFTNCTFKGVTYVETETDCVHENWNYAGARTRVVLDPGPPIVYDYPLAFDGLEAELAGVPVPDTKVMSNNIRFDGCTFLGSVASDVPAEYAHWRNKLQFTGETRFFVDPADEELDPGDTDDAAIIAALNAMDADDLAELAKSSILTAGYSVDVGNFNNEVAIDPEDTPKVRLKGTIVAGIIDVRGTADVHGTLLMTLRPEEAVGPLFYGGLPDVFNTTIGYFGPTDGDGEGIDPDDAAFAGFGEITLRYNPDALLPDGIPWPIRILPEAVTYTEGGF